MFSNLYEKSVKRRPKDTFLQEKKNKLLDCKAKKKNRVKKWKELLQLYDDFDFENMLFTDEKIFTIEEEYNSQNTRMYSKYFAELNDNEKFAFHQLHPEYLMVWAGVSCKGKINLIFLEKEASSAFFGRMPYATM